MKHVLAVVDDAGGAAIAIAKAMAEVLHANVQEIRLAVDSGAQNAATAELFTRTGVDLVILHVFDEATVPRFWDQAAHAQQPWEEEFLARHCAYPGVRMELRSGVTGEQVVNVAAAEQVDLIALG